MNIAMIPVATTLRNRYGERCFADERTTARLARRSRNRVHRCALRNRYLRRRGSRCNRNREVLRERLLLRAVATSVTWYVGDDALYVNRRDVLSRAYRCERTQGESRSEYGSGLRARLLAKTLRNVHLKEIRRSRRACRQYRRNDSRLNPVAIHINNSIVIFRCLLFLYLLLRAGSVRLFGSDKHRGFNSGKAFIERLLELVIRDCYLVYILD